MPTKSASDNTIDPDVLQAFQSEVDYILQKNRNQICAPETGNWFFHHPLYRRFQDGKGPHLLFLTAEAGGGKSTVMRTLADKVAESAASSDSVLVAYFFFKDDDGRLSSYSEALICLVYQLLVQEPKLAVHVRRICEERRFKVKNDTKLMWDILSSIGSSSAHEILCVVDAIDECSSVTRPQLVADLKAFFDDPAQADSRLKMIASSRPYEDKTHPYDSLFSDSPTNILHLAGEEVEVQPYIRGVIRTKAEDLVEAHGLDSDAKEMLVSNIIAKNRHTRSFLAVHMAFELLGSHYRMHNGADKGTISSILDDIPHQLDSQFDELLNQSLDREHARRIFCVILAARKTIKIKELRVIYSVTRVTENRPTCYEDLELPMDDEEFKHMVRARCGLFITFVKTSVHLFHQTAREHLLRRSETTASALNLEHPLAMQEPPTTADLSSWKDSISLQDANLVCAAICFNIMSFPVPEKVALDIIDGLDGGMSSLEETLSKFAAARPFFHYAALNWHEHFINAGAGAHDLLSSAEYKPILDISKPEFWTWFITVANEVLSGIVKNKSPIAAVWAVDDRIDYGTFLRDRCITKLFKMDRRVHALLSADPVPPADTTFSDGEVVWKAEHGFRLIDRFHLAGDEYHHISFVERVRAVEQGDMERGSLLADMQLNAWMWTSMSVGALKAFKEGLSSAKDMSWLHDIPGHIVNRCQRSDAWDQKSGSVARYHQGWLRQSEWRSVYPPSFALMLRASTLDTGEPLFGALADWIDEHPLRSEYSQQLWEAGGFIIPSLCRRLVASGASIDCRLWDYKGTPLHFSAAFWAHDAVQCLLDLGADATIITLGDYNTLHWFSYQDELSYRPDFFRRNKSLKRVVLRHLYEKASIESSVRAIANSVPDKNVLLNQPARKGLTPLMCAVRSSRWSPTIVKALLEQGAKVDLRDNRGRTALMHFFGSGFIGRPVRILRNILTAGADPKVLDVAGKSVLDYFARLITAVQLANLYPGFNSYNRAFHALANDSSLSEQDLCDELKRLRIPLVVAARLGNAQVCSLMLAAGANPNEHGMKVPSRMTYNSGTVSSDLKALDWNPLLVALSSKAYVTAALLIEGGANVKYQTRKRTRTKFNRSYVVEAARTPLHIAVGAHRSYQRADLHVGPSSKSKGCSFRAAANLRYEVDRMTGLEKLTEFQRRNHRDSKDEGEEVSDPEYERVSGTAISNDSRGSHLLPYDTIEKITPPRGTPDEPLLSVIYDSSLKFEQRQQAIVELILAKGALVNACTVEDVTPLAICCRGGYVNVAQTLLKHGADPNHVDAGGCTPLMSAADRGHAPMVELLLKSGADPNVQLRGLDPAECPCADFLRWSTFTHDKCHAPYTALALAAKRGHETIVKLLLKHGAKVNQEITHHAHGRLLSAREKRRGNRWLRKASDDDSDSESESEEASLWKGYISVATALTWARGNVRNILMRHGADPGIEQERVECKCFVGPKEIKSTIAGDSDEYPARGSSADDEPTRRDSPLEESSDELLYELPRRTLAMV